MGLFNDRLSHCPFTGVQISESGDPTPALDGISYFGTYNGHRFPIKLHSADPWGKDTWLSENGHRFIEVLYVEGRLFTYFKEGRRLAEIKRDYRVG